MPTTWDIMNLINSSHSRSWQLRNFSQLSLWNLHKSSFNTNILFDKSLKTHTDTHSRGGGNDVVAAKMNEFVSVTKWSYVEILCTTAHIYAMIYWNITNIAQTFQHWIFYTYTSHTDTQMAVNWIGESFIQLVNANWINKLFSLWIN